MPTRSWIAFSSTWSVRLSFASSAPSGSSRSRTAGCSTSARARATRLLLASRQLVDAALLVAGELYQLEHLADALFDLRFVEGLVLEPECDIAGDVEEREQRVALEHRVDVAFVGWKPRDVDAVEHYPAGGRFLEPGHEPEGGRLAASRRPEQREELTGVYLERQVVHRDEVGEPLREAD